MVKPFFRGRAEALPSAVTYFFRRGLDLLLPLPKDFIVSRIALAAIRRILGRIEPSPPYPF